MTKIILNLEVQNITIPQSSIIRKDNRIFHISSPPFINQFNNFTDFTQV
jgi:hypothetical protein